MATNLQGLSKKDRFKLRSSEIQIKSPHSSLLTKHLENINIENRFLDIDNLKASTIHPESSSTAQFDQPLTEAFTKKIEQEYLDLLTKQVDESEYAKFEQKLGRSTRLRDQVKSILGEENLKFLTEILMSEDNLVLKSDPSIGVSLLPKFQQQVRRVTSLIQKFGNKILDISQLLHKKATFRDLSEKGTRKKKGKKLDDALIWSRSAFLTGRCIQALLNKSLDYVTSNMVRFTNMCYGFHNEVKICPNVSCSPEFRKIKIFGFD